jgi:hypothetical protein
MQEVRDLRACVPKGPGNHPSNGLPAGRSELLSWCTLVPVIDRRQRETSDVPEERRTSRNRRAFPRWPAEFQVRFYVDGRLYNAQPVEIGETGLSMFVEEDLQFEREFDLEFRLLDLMPDWVRVKATLKHATAHRCGVEFLNLRRADRLKIIDYIYGGRPQSFTAESPQQ